jgi:hypothetical protein
MTVYFFWYKNNCVVSWLLSLKEHLNNTVRASSFWILEGQDRVPLVLAAVTKWMLQLHFVFQFRRRKREWHDCILPSSIGKANALDQYGNIKYSITCHSFKHSSLLYIYMNYKSFIHNYVPTNTVSDKMLLNKRTISSFPFVKCLVG